MICLMPGGTVAAGVLVIALAVPARASDTLQWGGFALLRGSAGASGLPLEDDSGSAQVQVGIDWRPSMTLGGHVHLLARGDGDGSKRGRVGVVEAFLDQNLRRGDHRLRLMEGAFFLPGSRENIDALWESPYTITSSALNSWMGEEFRPIGVDAAYTFRRSWTGGVTVYRGNDTFGALPAARGWALRDDWALLGEHIAVDGDYFSSVTAETDHRLGWAARGRWNNDRVTVQLTHIDNRADALEHGELLNWSTQWDVVGGDYTNGDWTVAGESGWGVTSVIFGVEFPSNIRASYVLVSRRFAKARASLRAEAFEVAERHDHAVTAAFFWSPPGKVRTGIEAIVLGGKRRVSLEVRYNFH